MWCLQISSSYKHFSSLWHICRPSYTRSSKNSEGLRNARQSLQWLATIHQAVLIYPGLFLTLVGLVWRFVKYIHCSLWDIHWQLNIYWVTIYWQYGMHIVLCNFLESFFCGYTSVLCVLDGTTGTSMGHVFDVTSRVSQQSSDDMYNRTLQRGEKTEYLSGSQKRVGK